MSMRQLYPVDSPKRTYLWGVKRAEILGTWPLVEEYIENACNNSELYWPSEIKTALIKGDYQLWVSWSNDRVRACLVTTLEQSQRTMWIRGILCAGDGPDDWVYHIDQIEAWAKAQGAEFSHLLGRPGFEKWLKPKGYRRTHTLMEKRL